MTDLGRALHAALEARRSARGFHPAEVPRDDLRALFAMAQRAPSWCNIQPWQVWVTAPAKTAQLSAALVAAATSSLPAPEVPFPVHYPEPYLARRRACGFALYDSMGIERHDKPARQGAWLRNYQLFDAPHLAVVTQDQALGPYGTLDVGVWLGYLLASAQALGIDSCPMAAVAAYPEVLRKELGIPPHLTPLFGVALGFADPAVAANRCRTTREPLDANVQFVGFATLPSPDVG